MRSKPGEPPPRDVYPPPNLVCNYDWVYICEHSVSLCVCVDEDQSGRARYGRGYH